MESKASFDSMEKRCANAQARVRQADDITP